MDLEYRCLDFGWRSGVESSDDLSGTMDLVVDRSCRHMPDKAATLLERALATNGLDAVIAAVNDPQLLGNFVGMHDRGVLVQAWRMLGRYFALDQRSEALTKATFEAMEKGVHEQSGVRSSMDPLLPAVCSAATGREAAAIRAITNWNKGSTSTLFQIYRELRADRPYSDVPDLLREAERAVPNLRLLELDLDLKRAEPNRRLSVVLNWVMGSRDWPDEAIGSAVRKASGSMLNEADASAKPALARSILCEPPIACHLQGDDFKSIFAVAMSDLTLESGSGCDTRFVSEYVNHPDVTSEDRLLLGACFDLSHSTLSERSLQFLNARFAQLDEQAYRRELGAVLKRYVTFDVPAKALSPVLCFCYVYAHRETYWAAFWDNFIAMWHHLGYDFVLAEGAGTRPWARVRREPNRRRKGAPSGSPTFLTTGLSERGRAPCPSRIWFSGYGSDYRRRSIP